LNVSTSRQWEKNVGEMLLNWLLVILSTLSCALVTDVTQVTANSSDAVDRALALIL
jgi:hypothetical protein